MVGAAAALLAPAGSAASAARPAGLPGPLVAMLTGRAEAGVLRAALGAVGTGWVAARGLR